MPVDEQEPNNNIAAATALPICEDPVGSGFLTSSIALGALDPGNDSDYWSFPAVEGDQLIVNMELTSGNDPRSRFIVYNAAAESLVDSQTWGRFGSPEKATNAVYTIPASGTYYVSTLSDRSDRMGTYELRVDLGRDVQLEPFDRNFANQTIETASPLALLMSGERRRGTIAGSLYSQDNADVYSIGTVNPGETIFVTTRLPSDSELLPAILLRDERNQFYMERGNQPAFDGVATIDVIETHEFFVVVSPSGGEGIRGQYLLDILISPVESFPDFFVSEVLVSPSEITAGGDVQVNWTVRNDGNEITPVDRWIDRLYLSSDRLLGEGDILLDSLLHEGSLDVTAGTNTYTTAHDATIPDNVHGDYYILVQTDAGNSVAEFVLENNNTTA